MRCKWREEVALKVMLLKRHVFSIVGYAYTLTDVLLIVKIKLKAITIIMKLITHKFMNEFKGNN